MILTVEEAEKIKPGVTREELDGLEQFIRAETLNSFQNRAVRFPVHILEPPSTLHLRTRPMGLRPGDTIELNYSRYNEGLYVIDELGDNFVTLVDADLYDEHRGRMSITKVEYPKDIKTNVLKLLEYDVKMSDKIGLKAKSVARISETYHDMTKAESKNGRPVYLWDFLDNYRKYGW